VDGGRDWSEDEAEEEEERIGDGEMAGTRDGWWVLKEVFRGKRRGGNPAIILAREANFYRGFLRK
jgi:hypothetical protein